MDEHVGRYRIIRKLATGGGSSVFLAYDPQLSCEVALKVIPPDLLKDPVAGPVRRALLLNEQLLLGKLDHPNIVRVYDVSIDTDNAYVVMDYIDGGTLEQFCLPNTLLPVRRVVDTMLQCARALDYAFRCGVIHRDIKPANILMGQDEKVFVSDFGSALLDFQDNTQVSGVGSPVYMSPEQVHEQALDHRTDIYSLGVVLYQLLSGHLPFEGKTTYQVIFQIINNDPLPLSILRPMMPLSLEAIVNRAMNRRIEERYQSWHEMIAALENFIGHDNNDLPDHESADDEKFYLLRGFSFFSDFSDAEIWEVVRFSAWHRFEAGQTVISEGESGDSFYFVASGAVQIAKKDRTLDLLIQGDCFGEVALIGKKRRPRTANVVALNEADIIAIHIQALERASPDCRLHFSQAFLEVMAQRIIMTNALLSLSD